MKTLGSTSKYHLRGITLLLTLMVLVILAVVIVQFQADTALQIRAQSYRLERQQCRYAAESGIIVAARMIEQYLARPLSTVSPTPTDQNPSAPASSDPNSLDDYPEYPQTQPTEKPAFIMMQNQVTIGPASVDIEVHDEDAKWPLFWLLRSPYDPRNTANKITNAFVAYARYMDVGSADATSVVNLVQLLGNVLNLPSAPVYIQESPRSGSLSRRGRRIEYTQRVAQDQARQKVMGAFALRWRDNLRHDPEAQIVRQPLKTMPGAFGDYFSIWGANYINLNTASAELLETAFMPLGLTKRQVQEIVKFRRETPFTNTGQLTGIRGISPQLSDNIGSLCTVRSQTFSVYVQASFGRARYRLAGGLYVDHRNRLQKAAVFSGD